MWKREEQDFQEYLDASARHGIWLLDNPAWQELTAVKEGRVYFMDKALYGVKPNHRWSEAYQIVEEILENGKS